MKTIEEFYNEVIADKELSEALDKARSENRLEEFLTEHGVDDTTADFGDLVRDDKQTGIELSDSELEKASGGEGADNIGLQLRNMFSYLCHLVADQDVLRDSITGVTYSINLVSVQIPGKFELVDIEGKKMSLIYYTDKLYMALLDGKYRIY
ncbi:MAG: hypothetical protein ACI4XA_01060 [Oscillospiraceae bacterium]